MFVKILTQLKILDKVCGFVSREVQFLAALVCPREFPNLNNIFELFRGFFKK